jgi:Na+/phosphate symporter
MLIAWFAVLVMIVGLLLYFIPTKTAKFQSIGMAMFCIGLFFVVWAAGPKTTIRLP